MKGNLRRTALQCIFRTRYGDSLGGVGDERCECWGPYLCVAVSRRCDGVFVGTVAVHSPSSFRVVLIPLRADLKLPQVPLGGQFSWAR